MNAKILFSGSRRGFPFNFPVADSLLAIEISACSDYVVADLGVPSIELIGQRSDAGDLELCGQNFGKILQGRLHLAQECIRGERSLVGKSISPNL